MTASTALVTCALLLALPSCVAASCPPHSNAPPGPVAQPVPPQKTAATEAAAPLPRRSDKFSGWFVNGPARSVLHVAHDRDVKHSGSTSARIECGDMRENEFAGLMQQIDATRFRGKRVRYSASVKTRELEDTAALWMRVDRPAQHSSAFDNMQDRPIEGTTEWKRYEVVLDVAADASVVSFGIHLTGRGTAWIDDVSLEPVDASVPTTGGKPSDSVLGAPRNLDFEN